VWTVSTFVNKLRKFPTYRHRPIWVRFVPGLTDDPADVEQIASFAASLGNVERVQVLPFHPLGRYKWEQLGLQYTLGDVQPPSTDPVNRRSALFRAAGLTAWSRQARDRTHSAGADRSRRNPGPRRQGSATREIFLTSVGNLRSSSSSRRSLVTAGVSIGSAIALQRLRPRSADWCTSMIWTCRWRRFHKLRCV
jgi:hypothetical protein